MNATMNATERPAGTRATDRLLAAARARISTVDAHESARLQATGATLVDTRPAAQRAEFGEIAGALVIERNVLEWRLDPDGDHRLTTIDHTRPIVVFCQEGYASSLAVASLVDLGLTDVHDLAGGFAAWSAAGLPVQATPSPSVPQGSDPPRSSPAPFTPTSIMPTSIMPTSIMPTSIMPTSIMRETP
jgi:rhodanese-related sulfurtransferase